MINTTLASNLCGQPVSKKKRTTITVGMFGGLSKDSLFPTDVKKLEEGSYLDDRMKSDFNFSPLALTLGCLRKIL